MAHTLEQILAASAKLDGKVPAVTGEINITCRPASFVSTGKGMHPAGSIVRGVRIGNLKQMLQSFHVEALLRYYGVWDKVDPAVLAASFAHTPKASD